VMAVGVARARASGQAITTVATATVKAKTGSAPTSSQMIRARAPDPRATKTSYLPAWSASRWAGALLL